MVRIGNRNWIARRRQHLLSLFHDVGMNFEDFFCKRLEKFIIGLCLRFHQGL